MLGVMDFRTALRLSLFEETADGSRNWTNRIVPGGNEEAAPLLKQEAEKSLIDSLGCSLCGGEVREKV